MATNPSLSSPLTRAEERQQGVEVELQDLHHPAPGLGQQQQHPFGLLIARAAVGFLATELAGDPEHAAHHRILDDLVLAWGFGTGAGTLAGSVEATVLDPER